ncbi:hypothetical protein Ancab_014882, partial [Ancistrocladus abbreviatus]
REDLDVDVDLNVKSDRPGKSVGPNFIESFGLALIDRIAEHAREGELNLTGSVLLGKGVETCPNDASPIQTDLASGPSEALRGKEILAIRSKEREEATEDGPSRPPSTMKKRRTKAKKRSINLIVKGVSLSVTTKKDDMQNESIGFEERIAAGEVDEESGSSVNDSQFGNMNRTIAPKEVERNPEAIWEFLKKLGVISVRGEENEVKIIEDQAVRDAEKAKARDKEVIKHPGGKNGNQ